MDYPMTELLRNMSFVARFVKNGHIVYEGIGMAYALGLFTGQRPGAYSLSLNERQTGGWYDNLLMALYTRLHHPVSLAMRDVSILRVRSCTFFHRHWPTTTTSTMPRVIFHS